VTVPSIKRKSKCEGEAFNFKYIVLDCLLNPNEYTSYRYKSLNPSNKNCAGVWETAVHGTFEGSKRKCTERQKQVAKD
jgi:hypothetical protein